ncbi:YkgJ family cysteine cluster protein [Candidatus Pacearchaeota archaeon]|nr:YkgJ family cysteine cluster protein [Candidatus Pacearchaeota archaeon]
MDMDPEKFVSAMKEGFDCRRCGTCCIVWKIPVTDEDITLESKLTEKVKDGFMEKGDHDLPCSFYNTINGCSIYETRPQTCRDFKASPVKCMAAKISTTGIDINTTVEAWKERGLDELTILSNIYAKYVEILVSVLKMKRYVIGGKTMKDDLEDDFLLKTVKERTLV